MGIKNISGADFKAFYEDPSVWSLNGNADAFYCEDLVVVLKGQESLDIDAIYNRYGDNFENLPDDAVVELQCGYRFLNSGHGTPGCVPEEDMLVLFRQWQENRSQITFVASIQVHKTDTEALDRVEKALADLADLGVSVQRSDDKAVIPSTKLKP